ncbi:hypothetical protein CPB84DRAFT_958083 [Gymnopilus junonius]|uniref:Uncharacterized protein n=1 Tax=Gymnopilus junonius TaxID=109634 RepID=A0A9P5NNR8_GYMJU|nr:hypothetical protein CPB84DRAFT_958083 [Gymnopilus junonius]
MSMLFALPLIYDYSAKVQFSVLFALLLISYLNRKARVVIAILATGVIIFKLAVPLSSWAIYVAKGIAMLGFYVKFFWVGLDYIKSGVDYVFPDFLDGLVETWEKGQEEDRMKEEAKRREARWEEERRYGGAWEEAYGRKGCGRMQISRRQGIREGRRKENGGDDMMMLMTLTRSKAGSVSPEKSTHQI